MSSAVASSSSRQSTQAIKIPHSSTQHDPTYISAAQRRRRSIRHSTKPPPLEHTSTSDAGSSSLSSEQDSSWSGSHSLRTPPPHLSHHHHHHDAPATSTMTTPSSRRKDKTPIYSYHAQNNNDNTPPPTSNLPTHRQRPSHTRILSTSASPLGHSMQTSTSYTSINLNDDALDPDEPPRLITYTKSGQGFTWNDELFVPGYLLGRYGNNSGRRRRRREYDGDFGDDECCPVTEIFVTDEEAEAMMP